MEHGTAPVCRVDGAPGLVALTFDDGDDPVAWEAILDELREEDAPATFFPSGMRVEGFPELAQRTRDEGHTVGSHGYDHARLAGRSFEDIQRNLERDREAWRRVLGSAPTLFRPPYGDWDPGLLRIAAEVGYGTPVQWDVDPKDWRGTTAPVIEARTLEGARDGSIVVLHVMPTTAEALLRILERLRQRGLNPATVPTLVEAGRPVAATRTAAASGRPRTPRPDG